MPSPVSGRRAGEWVLRVLSVALLGILLMRAWSPLGQSTLAESAKGGVVASSLPHWSITSPGRIHLTLDSILTPSERDWVAAIERAGSRVTWDAPRVVPVAAVLTRVVDPAGVSELDAWAPAKSVVRIDEHGGAIDSAIVGTNGIRFEIPGASSGIALAVDATRAKVAVPDSVVFRRVLVEGSASWETKFTIEALTERGWVIDAITHVAPGVDVREGNPATPDTSRYAALIAVDTTATFVARGAGAFVRSGGGLVTLADASAVGPRGKAPVVLERGSGGDVRASRFGDGRVVRVSYKDIWRRRMADNDTIADPVAAHRAWLARVVAAVAYAPHILAVHDSLADPAPLADMVDRMGPRSPTVDDRIPLQEEVPSSVLFGILLASLLIELTSRRLRGVR